MVTAVGSRVMVMAQENEPVSGVISAAEIEGLSEVIIEETESTEPEEAPEISADEAVSAQPEASAEAETGGEEAAEPEQAEPEKAEETAAEPEQVEPEKAEETAAEPEEAPIILQSIEAEIYKINETAEAGSEGKTLYVLDQETKDSVVLEGYMPEGAIVKVYPAETDLAEELEVEAYEIRIFEADGETAFEPESDRDIVVYIKSGRILEAIEAEAEVAFWRMNDSDVAPRIGQYYMTIDNEIGLESYSPWMAFAWEIPEEETEGTAETDAPAAEETAETEVPAAAEDAEPEQAGVLEVPENEMLAEETQPVSETAENAAPEDLKTDEAAGSETENEAKEEVPSIVDSATEQQVYARAEARTVSASSAALAAITTLTEEVEEESVEQASADDEELAVLEAKEEEAAEEKTVKTVAARSQQVITAELYTDDTYTQLYEAEGVSVTLEGLLPEGSTVKAYPVMNGIDGEETYAAYSVTIYDADGSIYSPVDGEFITVTFDDPKIREAAEDRKELHGWHKDHETGEYSDLDFLILSDGRVRFITDSF
ncbi:MAG: hypothetical protein K6E30_11280 [Lachnospiraceae bacterium]|nr:hypothetical protein [Lachnospiraceae bacterium]